MIISCCKKLLTNNYTIINVTINYLCSNQLLPENINEQLYDN